VSTEVVAAAGRTVLRARHDVFSLLADPVEARGLVAVVVTVERAVGAAVVITVGERVGVVGPSVSRIEPMAVEHVVADEPKTAAQAE